MSQVLIFWTRTQPVAQPTVKYTDRSRRSHESSTADPMNFSYAASLDDRSIRVVRMLPDTEPNETVKLEIETHALESVPRYIAWSYTWQSPDPDTKPYEESCKVPIL